MNKVLKNQTADILTFCCSLVFFYSATTKLFDFSGFQLGLFRNPIIPHDFAVSVSYLIPILETIIAVLMLFDKSKIKALIGFFILLVMFTIYIALFWIMDVERPCSCGGLIAKLSFNMHFILNLFLLLISAYSILLFKKCQSEK